LQLSSKVVSDVVLTVPTVKFKPAHASRHISSHAIPAFATPGRFCADELELFDDLKSVFLFFGSQLLKTLVSRPASLSNFDLLATR
jgi:hypothetical protein